VVEFGFVEVVVDDVAVFVVSFFSVEYDESVGVGLFAASSAEWDGFEVFGSDFFEVGEYELEGCFDGEKFG